MSFRSDFQDSALDLLSSVTRELIDKKSTIASDEWQLVKTLVKMVEDTSRNSRGYADYLSPENKTRLELVQRRMKLLSSELDPQPEVIRLCSLENPDTKNSHCIVVAYHSTDVPHIDTSGRTWKSVR